MILNVPPLNEASGLAVSRRTSNLFYSLNDSGGQPVLYAFDNQGKSRGQLRIRGVKNRDWEALASIALDGRAYLVIGDVGDNLAMRGDSVIHVVEEPDPTRLSSGHETPCEVAWSLSFRFSDGPRDCETMLVDARRKEILLVAKRTMPQTIYRLPLSPTPGQRLVANPVGALAGLPQPSSWQRLVPSPRGRYRGQPTDGAISEDNSIVAILTYGCVALYRRESGQSWPQALAEKPRLLLPHDIELSEALCLSQDGKRIFVTGEGSNSTFVEYTMPVTLRD